MEQIKTKELKNKYDIIIVIPFGSMKRLLDLMNKKYYNCGKYGWNYVVYEYDCYAFITGYRVNIKNCIKTDSNTALDYELSFIAESRIKNDKKKFEEIMNMFIECEVL